MSRRKEEADLLADWLLADDWMMESEILHGRLFFFLLADWESGRKVGPGQELDSQKKNQIEVAPEYNCEDGQKKERFS